jgi:hypothetical protein
LGDLLAHGGVGSVIDRCSRCADEEASCALTADLVAFGSGNDPDVYQLRFLGD